MIIPETFLVTEMSELVYASSLKREVKENLEGSRVALSFHLSALGFHGELKQLKHFGYSYDHPNLGDSLNQATNTTLSVGF